MYELSYYIIFDVERNFRPYQSNAPSEVVDIGAIKIEASTMSIVDRFSSLVKPTASLSRHTTKLTGIEKQDVKHADKFPKVIGQFSQFLGENYMLVTWGKEDYSFLREDCTLHHVACPDLGRERRFDLQQFVFRAYEELFPHQPSLKFAVDQLGLQWEGEQHRALDDAANTANIFLKAAAQKDIHKTYKRNAEATLIQDGILTEKGRKKMKRWVFKELKKSGRPHLTWEAFLNSKTWESISDQYCVDDETVVQLRKYFQTALRKAKQQIQVLKDMSKKVKNENGST